MRGISAAVKTVVFGAAAVVVCKPAASALPGYASAYALPHDLAQRHRIRRYGFHGIAHEYMLMRYAEITGTSTRDAVLITLQLGNGCSGAIPVSQANSGGGVPIGPAGGVLVCPVGNPGCTPGVAPYVGTNTTP